TDPTVLGFFGAAAFFAALFAWRELTAREPMLQLSYFRNPRFSVASSAISIASFGLYGSSFVLTQFLQDAHGYSALQAGAAMVPLAFGLIMGSGSSTKAVGKLGTARVVTTGLAGLGTVLLLSFLWSPHMAYWPFAIWVWGLAFSMGWVMAPS